MHHDVLLSQPEGTEALGSSPACEVQGMFRAGKLLMLQAHPEFDGKTVRDLLAASADLGFEDRTLLEEAMRNSYLPHDGELVAERVVKFTLGIEGGIKREGRKNIGRERGGGLKEEEQGRKRVSRL